MLPMRCACPQQPAPLSECHVLTGPALLQRKGGPWCISETPLLVRQTGPIDGPGGRRGDVYYFFKLNYEFLKHRLEPGARGCALVGHGR